MNTKMRAGANGFSLVEVVVAMTILTVGVMALAAVMGGTNAVDRLARNRQEMVEAGESKFEELRAHATSLTADTVQLVVGGSLTMSVPNYNDSTFTASGNVLRRRWVVAAGPGVAREVTLRIEPSRGRTRGKLTRMELMSYITLAQR